MKRELLLLFKTNNYLRAIDLRLRSPGNTFTVINSITWQVYSREILAKDLSKYGWLRRQLVWAKHWLTYFMGVLALWAMAAKARAKMLIGLGVTEEEIQDFELGDLDVI